MNGERRKDQSLLLNSAKESIFLKESQITTKFRQITEEKHAEVIASLLH
jgi:hypothetical protein